jgi:hypothetical protein
MREDIRSSPRAPLDAHQAVEKADSLLSQLGRVSCGVDNHSIEPDPNEPTAATLNASLKDPQCVRLGGETKQRAGTISEVLAAMPGASGRWFFVNLTPSIYYRLVQACPHSAHGCIDGRGVHVVYRAGSTVPGSVRANTRPLRYLS